MYSFVRSELYESKFERYQIAQQATLMAIRPALGGVTIRTVQMIDISRGGASFEVSSTFGLPKHYYLNILGSGRRLGCAEVSRVGNRIHAQFIRKLDDAFLHKIVRYEFFTGGNIKDPPKKDQLMQTARP
ncbi:PilZ domain-containing protein [Ensifer soli]|uniref:PilZ domain-containing protein n=1 Tax=Ciceribacter sp. sgz301302 TaxID=3342379 RepID=UPI0035B78B82